jgi:ribonuclease HI
MRRQFAEVEVAEQPGNARKGVRAAEDLAEKGTLIGEFVGTITALADLGESKGESEAAFSPVLNFASSRQSAERAATSTVIDARKAGNNLRFLTPACDPNCTAEVWHVNGHPRLAVLTTRAVQAGEFLSLPHSSLLGDRRKCDACRNTRHDRRRGALVAYTDGSKSTDPKTPAGWGVVVVERPNNGSADHTDKHAGEVVEEMWGMVHVSRNDEFFAGGQYHSNNTGELTAIFEALIWFRDYSDHETFYIYTDSNLAVNYCNKSWSPNRDLARIATSVMDLLDEMEGRPTRFSLCCRVPLFPTRGTTNDLGRQQREDHRCQKATAQTDVSQLGTG